MALSSPKRVKLSLWVIFVTYVCDYRFSLLTPAWNWLTCYAILAGNYDLKLPLRLSWRDSSLNMNRGARPCLRGNRAEWLFTESVARRCARVVNAALKRGDQCILATAAFPG